MQEDAYTPDHLERTRLKQTIVVQKLITLYYFEFGKNYRFPGEKHDFWEFLYVDRGEIEVQADDERHTLKQGSIIFHKPNEFHQFHAVEGTAPNAIVVTFDCRSTAMKQFENKVLRLGEEERKLLVQMMNEGKNTFTFPFDHPLKRLDKPVLGSEQLLRCYLEIFLIMLLRKLEHPRATYGNLRSASRENDETALFDTISLYISERLHTKLSVHELCSHFYLNRTRLQSLFRKHAGVPVMEYVTRMRISLAKTYIREETYNITENANRLGFASIHYFSKAFKKETGMSPSEYARSVKARMRD